VADDSKVVSDGTSLADKPEIILERLGFARPRQQQLVCSAVLSDLSARRPSSVLHCCQRVLLHEASFCQICIESQDLHVHNDNDNDNDNKNQSTNNKANYAFSFVVRAVQVLSLQTKVLCRLLMYARAVVLALPSSYQGICAVLLHRENLDPCCSQVASVPLCAVLSPLLARHM